MRARERLSLEERSKRGREGGRTEKMGLTCCSVLISLVAAGFWSIGEMVVWTAMVAERCQVETLGLLRLR